MTLKTLLSNLEIIQVEMDAGLRPQLKLSKEFGELTSYYRDVPYAEMGLFPNPAIRMHERDKRECTIREFIDKIKQLLKERNYLSDANVLINNRSILTLKDCSGVITPVTASFAKLESFIKNLIKEDVNWMKVLYENGVSVTEFSVMSLNYYNDYQLYLKTVNMGKQFAAHLAVIADDENRKDTFVKAVNEVMPKLEEDDFCEWIKYDYRTICPKYHDADNPYWRIPENMDKLKYCPYCGKEIKIVE